jgi:hypothetical protein
MLVKNENLKSRLINWKFESALKYLDGEEEGIKVLVGILARMYGNCGWFSGDMAALIAAALESIGIEDPDDSEK